MEPLEEYLRQADDLAQSVVDAWGANVSAGNAGMLTADFKELLEKAIQYRTAKQVANSHREMGLLNERASSSEQATREAFASAYKILHENNEGDGVA